MTVYTIVIVIGLLAIAVVDFLYVRIWKKFESDLKDITDNSDTHKDDDDVWPGFST